MANSSDLVRYGFSIRDTVAVAGEVVQQDRVDALDNGVELCARSRR